MNENEYYLLKGYVSNSSLNYIEESPEKFRKYLNGELEETTASYLSTGTLTHMKVLEKAKYAKEVVPFEYTTPGSAQRKKFIETFAELKDKKGLDEALIESYKGSYSTKESDEKVLEKATVLRKTLESYERYLKASKVKTVIQPKEAEKINSLEAKLKEHKATKELLFSTSDLLDDGETVAYNEHMILWQWNGVKCKSLIDRIVVDKKNKVVKLVDLKTTSKMSEFESSFKKYHYNRQIAFYLMAIRYGIKDFIDEGETFVDYKIEAYIAAVDTITQEVKAFQIKKDTIDKATIEVEKLITKAQWHLENNEWTFPMEYHIGDGYDEL